MHILFFGQQWEPEIGIPQRRGTWMADVAERHGATFDVVTAPPHYPTGKLLSTEPQHGPSSIERRPSGSTIRRSRFRPHTSTLVSRILDQATISLSSIPVGIRAVRERRPDIVVTTAPPLPSILIACGFAKALRVPFVVDLRDAWPELVSFITKGESPSTKRKVLGTLFAPAFHTAGAILGLGLKQADGMIATNDVHAQYLSEKYKVETVTVTNLPLVNLHAEESNLPVDDSDRHDGTLRVLYTGTVGRAQDLERAVEAVKIAQDHGVDVCLRIIGGGSNLRHVRELTEALGLQAEVELLKRIPRAELAAHNRWADTVLVQLKDWHPLHLSVPSKVFEAIASGKHVTAALSGAAAEIVHRSGAGTVVPPGDSRALADHFMALATDHSSLGVNAGGREWISAELTRQNPEAGLVRFMKGLVARGR